ncbi:MAG: HlyD family efflux transporter periplasmic adaptor subunit [Gemmatimonadaceae bacterium]
MIGRSGIERQKFPAGTASDETAPFLDVSPPHWAARGLAYFLIALFVTTLIASIAIRVPESVSGPFTLVPIHGADPIRALHPGRVTAMLVTEGSEVSPGAPLFAIQSEQIGDRYGELRTLSSQLRGATERASNARRQYDGERRAQLEEDQRLRVRLANLNRTIELKRSQLEMARQLADNLAAGTKSGAVSGSEATAKRLEADRLASDLEELQGTTEEMRVAIQKLRHETSARETQFRELQRSLDEELEAARIRTGVLENELAPTSGSGLTVAAPCRGTVLRLHVNSAGTVVQEGDILAEVACAGDRLQGEMTVAQSGVALMRPGQGVKLLYDAFPYQRFGVRYGTVRWIGPAAIPNEEATGFRALIELRDTVVRVRGQERRLLPGMGGRARVVVGRRTLVSYAFEPIRQLKESVADFPQR